MYFTNFSLLLTVISVDLYLILCLKKIIYKTEMKGCLLVLILVFVLLIQNGRSASVNDSISLRTQLFTINLYDKLVRPSSNQSVPLEVSVNMTLVGLSGLDEVTQELTTTAYLVISWTDELLTWTPSNYGDISYLYVSQSDIWKPDITLQNGFTEIKELGSSFILAKVENNGKVTWKPYVVFETKCDVYMRYFPFDDQICPIKFVLWTSTSSDVILQTSVENGITLENLDSNGQWYISSVIGSNNDEKTEITFYVNLSRKPLFFLITILVPVPDSGEKIGYSITVFLAFAVYLTIVTSSFPKSSDSVSILASYITIQLVVGTCTVMVTTFQLRINFWETKQKKVPKWLQCFTRFSLIQFCKNKKFSCNDKQTSVRPGDKDSVLKSVEVEPMSKKTNSKYKNRNISFQSTVKNVMEKGETTKNTVNTDEIVEADKQKPEVTWKDVTSAMDFYLFWFFILFIVLSTLSVFLSGTAK
ncbi:hypothetical protein KUTeg_013276 [Tegillarca granosa]|uniref:Uncharacterized protein n=1 Tax=Tegillarca granosa TaxID=220873 RepID=A0ABQ9EWP1_TEGGR|nr:hypothetical protein KUTeg_013276 [Tegillarca granosa]